MEKTSGYYDDGHTLTGFNAAVGLRFVITTTECELTEAERNALIWHHYENGQEVGMSLPDGRDLRGGELNAYLQNRAAGRLRLRVRLPREEH